MNELIKDCVFILGLRKPFNIKLRSKSHKTNNAEYWAITNDKGKLIRHRIDIFLGNQDSNQRNVETLIAHEFVHAWQMEKTNYRKHHGKKFIHCANLLEKALAIKYPSIKNIYDKNLDVD